MRIVRDNSWMRRGTTLLWGAGALSRITSPGEVRSVRQFLELAQNWPEDLPGSNTQALVVAGIEGCLDALSPEDGERLLDQDLKRAILSFQSEYEGQVALIFWLPSGRSRIHMSRASERYLWRCGPPNLNKDLELGRILWAGAEGDAARIMEDNSQDTDGQSWIGLYHPRIS